MFLALPEDKFEVPRGLAMPRATYWRTLSISSNTAWYLVTLKMDGQDAPSRSILFWWDVDLVDALKKCEGNYESLLCFQRATKAEGGGWSAIQIKEVWTGRHHALPDQETPMFLTAKGEVICGPLGRNGDGAERVSCVARQDGFQ